MRIELWIVSWLIFAVSIVYWDIHRLDDEPPISTCHKAEVILYKDKYLCTECEKWCEIK